MFNIKLKNLQYKINYVFKDEKLLIEALIHPSMTKIMKKNYERLEFLGNSILSAVLADIIFNTFPYLNEGKLSIIFAKMSSTNGIFTATESIDIGNFMILDNGEEKNDGRQNIKNIENCIEALIGSIYLDGGYAEAKNFIMKFWHDKIVKSKNLDEKDAKSQLQEFCQKHHYDLPEYVVVSQTGAVHTPSFTISCRVKINATLLEVESTNKTKKAAEQHSAQKMLKYINLLF